MILYLNLFLFTGVMFQQNIYDGFDFDVDSNLYNTPWIRETNDLAVNANDSIDYWQHYAFNG